MNEYQMREVIRQEMNAVGSLREAAKKWKLSPAYLSDCLNGRRNPGPAILRALGYVRVVKVTYQKLTSKE